MRLNKRGFSLVELIVVVAIFGVVSTVILDLYLNVQRSTATSEEVVEVQQGMRLALEQMAHDIQMAGILIPIDAPITVAANNSISMETATTFGAIARIPAGIIFPSGTTAVDIVVMKAMADLFRDDNYVRIINPLDGCQPTSTATDCARDATAPHFQITDITAVTPATVPPTTTLELTPTSSLAAAVTIPAGSMIVRVPSPSDEPSMTYPNVVNYDLDSTNKVLRRNWASVLSNNDRIIATNITGLRFEYLLDDGTTQLAGTALTLAQREKIVAVRIFLTGQTENAKAGENKTRVLQTTVKIRNV